jgi:hypothetical protein
MRRLAVILSLAVCLGAQGKEDYELLPKEVLKALDDAETLTLFSLDPDPEKLEPENSFLGVNIVGKLEVKGKAREQILEPLKKGDVFPKKPESIKKPNAGLRAKSRDGKKIELLISFNESSIRLNDGVGLQDDPPKALFVAPIDLSIHFRSAFEGAGVPLEPAYVNKLRENVLKVLTEAETLTVFSLEPAPTEAEAAASKEKFHRYVVLGKTKLDGAVAKKPVLDALLQGIAEHNGVVANCFIPRHGLRAESGGKRVDLVICFQCFSIRIFENAEDAEGQETRVVYVSGTPQEAFDKVLKAAKVPLARK